MKKQYQSPVVELNLIAVEDVMTASTPIVLGGNDFFDDLWVTNR